MVDEDEAKRQAWISAPLIAAKLDALTPALRAAAELAGMDTRHEAFQLALMIDPGSAHLRAVCTAPASDGRTGR